jgi:membrane protein implicated in regulation of membrane protease activity
MVIGWFIAFVILLVIELATVNLVTIWFAIGAVAAIITTVFTDSILIQSIVFVVVSVIALLITKPLIKKFKKFEVEPTNSDRVIGKVGDVVKKIEKNKYGEVKVYGNTWTASSKDVIEVGERVKVLSIDGVKLVVEKEKK